MRRATARDPAQRFADATEMLNELDAIVDELGLPHFRVPAPRNSALHNSAIVSTGHQHFSQKTEALGRPSNVSSVSQQTRAFTRAELPPPAPRHELEYQPPAARFAGIELAEFDWARQRSKRVLFFWVVAAITLAGLAAAGGWTLGSNLTMLL